MIDSIKTEQTPQTAHCRYCQYEWITRVAIPKACPRCARRLDKPNTKSKVQVA